MTRPLVDGIKAGILYWATHYTWTFVTIMVITVISCAFSINYLSTLEANLRDVYENDVQGGDSIQAAAVALVGVESAVKDQLVFPDARSRKKARARVEAKVAQLKASVSQAIPRFYTPRAKAAMATTRDDLKDFLATVPDAPDLDSLAKLQASAQVLQKDFDLLIANRTANSTKGIAELVGQLRTSLFVTIVILVVSVVIRVILYLAGHPRRRKNL